MKTKEIYGIKFNVYTEKEINRDFIKEDEAVYFENDIHIKGELKVKYLFCEKSIKVDRSYVVEKWEKVGGSQEVGGSQKVGEWQKVGWSQKVGEWQKVGGSQKVGEWQEVGGSQKVGEWQKVGGSLNVKSSRISLYSKVKGEYNVKGKVFIGVCEWRETTEEEETLECGKFISGDIRYGKLKEIGIKNEPQEEKKGKIVKVKINEQIIEGELVE